MRPFIRNTLFFIGWMLSPLTFWNDVFINIPLSYLLANLLLLMVRANFLLLLIISYWFTNCLGLYIMYVTGNPILKGREGVAKEIVNLMLTMAAYSLVILALGKIGILKPL